MENDVRVGQLIAGKYRVERVLGRGGMGVVMAALHEQLNQQVALKFLTDDAYQQPEAVARFVREARAAVQIRSEHGARVMDVGTLDDGAPYMVMEYLRGHDLKEVSVRRGPLPVSEAVDYVLQACDAIAEAHSLGIVHRDLKPANLFLTKRPDGSPLVKVLDFGISKALVSGERSSQLQMTSSAAIMGSPQYMSPEQIRSSKNVDARTDIWALGTILHELLTGRPAYEADTVPGLLAMIVADPPPPLSALRPDAPAELEAVVLRCLQKNREQRFATIAELAAALERFASNETRLLARRLAGVSSGRAQPQAGARPTPAFDLRPSGYVQQTRGPWSGTAALREAPADTPIHRRLHVQIWVATGFVGLAALLVWLLATRPASEPEALPEPQALPPVNLPAARAAETTIGVAPPSVAPPWVPPPTLERAAMPSESNAVDVEHANTRSSSAGPSNAARLRRLVGAAPRSPGKSGGAQHAGTAGASSAAHKHDPLDLFDDTK